MRKTLAAIALAGAICLLLPLTGAGALVIDDVAASVVAEVHGIVINVTPAPWPGQPFEVQKATGQYAGLILTEGAYTAHTGKIGPTAVGACAGTVVVAPNIPFTTYQDLLMGGGTIQGGSTLRGAFLTTCDTTSIGTFDGGGFVRAGTVAVAIFKLTLEINGVTGETLGTFVGAAAPTSGLTCKSSDACVHGLVVG